MLPILQYANVERLHAAWLALFSTNPDKPASVIAVTDSRKVILSISECLCSVAAACVVRPRAGLWRMLRSKATRAGAGARVDEVVDHHIPSNTDFVCLSSLTNVGLRPSSVKAPSTACLHLLGIPKHRKNLLPPTLRASLAAIFWSVTSDTVCDVVQLP